MFDQMMRYHAIVGLCTTMIRRVEEGIETKTTAEIYVNLKAKAEEGLELIAQLEKIDNYLSTEVHKVAI